MCAWKYRQGDNIGNNKAMVWHDNSPVAETSQHENPERGRK